MRIIVTGASGFVGRAACPLLRARGHEVEEVSTRNLADGAPPAQEPSPFAGAEAVVHLAARVHVMREESADPLALYRRANADGTRRAAEAAAAAGVKRFVLLSTAKVNGEATTTRPFREGDPPRPKDAYAISKWEAERALFDVAARTGMEAVVLRPPLVYGPGVKGNFLRLLKLCRAALPLPFGAIENRRSLIYVGNLADAIALALTEPRAAGQTYLVGDGDDVSTPELIRRLASALGRPARLFAAPETVLRLAGRLTGRAAAIDRLLDSLVIDDGKIRDELDWTPPFTMVQGLGDTAAWFLAGGAGRGESG